MKSLPLLAALLVLSPLPALAQTPRDTRPDTSLLAPPVAPSLKTSPTDSAIVAAVRAADDERLAATKAGDRARLEAIFSDDLHYSHSNTKVDSKATFVDALVAKKTVYESFQHKERTFVPAGPGVVVQHGKMIATVRGASGVNALDLAYLAVWRLENGKWRFLAWQSCKVPPADPAKK